MWIGPHVTTLTTKMQCSVTKELTYIITTLYKRDWKCRQCLCWIFRNTHVILIKTIVNYSIKSHSITILGCWLWSPLIELITVLPIYIKTFHTAEQVISRYGHSAYLPHNATTRALSFFVFRRNTNSTLS